MSYLEQRGERVHQAAVGAVNAEIARQGVTVSEVAKAAAMPRTTLHNRLRGKGDMTVSELVRVAIALDVPAAALLTSAMEAAQVEEERD
ncbi:hypothetical protein [Nocardioides sp. MH1]|uniref:hypothetical protein n=1 Tax=Nocardioides sp. MH1 TaxID=3242490 RepID=UPI003522C6C4